MVGGIELVVGSVVIGCLWFEASEINAEAQVILGLIASSLVLGIAHGKVSLVLVAKDAISAIFVENVGWTPDGATQGAG